MLNKQDIKDFLEAKVIQYNNVKFIESDPIQVPHQFFIKMLTLNLALKSLLFLYIVVH